MKIKNNKVIFFAILYLLMYSTASAQVKYIRENVDSIEYKSFITIVPDAVTGSGQIIVVFKNEVIEQAVRATHFAKSLNISNCEMDSMVNIINKAIFIVNKNNIYFNKNDYFGMSVHFHVLIPYKTVEIQGVIGTDVFFQELNRRIRDSGLSKSTKEHLLYLLNDS